MFVLEAYLHNREQKIQAWENACSAWLREKNKDGYNYYTRNDWVRNHPYPVVRWGSVAQIAIPVVVVIFLSVGAVGLILHHNSTVDHSKHTTSQVKKQPSDYKVGDKVQVVYGDFKDSVGDIVKIDNNGVVLKLSNSTHPDTNSTYGVNNGGLLTVDTVENLVPYKEVK